MADYNPDFASPCGLYCGVCAIYIADRDNNEKFKERLVNLYQGGVAGKGTLPGGRELTTADIKCQGCLSDQPFVFCQRCEIKDCVQAKGYAGCHECADFPCRLIEEFPMTVGKKVMLRAIPHWREVGTKKWIEDEEARYYCPECGHRLFRGVVRCNRCKTEVDLD
jgi:hypothetical protein